MGKRGPGAKRHRAAAKAYDQVATAAHPWDKAGMPEADRVIAFLQSLPIVSGLRAGEKMELIVFQEDFVRAVYGPRNADGDRLVRLAALSVGRGNGKSGLLSGLSLAHLLGPCAEPYGEVYAAALDREQSGILYRQARAYIEATPWMAARTVVRDWHKEITDEETQSKWTALTSDAGKALGMAPSFFIADECAAWRSRALFDNLLTGCGKRRSALGVAISTQAKDDHHFFSELLDAPPSPTVHIQLHTAPDNCALDDREAWLAANPALGVFLNEEQFADAAARAVRSTSFATSFRNLNLNQRVSADGAFIDPAHWQANAEPFDPADLDGEECFCGLDLSSTTDLCALVAYFPKHGRLLAWHFLPRDTIETRAAKDRVPYDVWVKEGWAEATPGNVRDDDAIILRLAEICSRYEVRSIHYDRWQIERLKKLLSDAGIDLPLVEFIQGFRSFAPATDAFETALLGGRMRHNNNPILKWQASNVVVETDAVNNRKPSKKKSTDRIDGIVAAIMAVGGAALAAPAPKPKKYSIVALRRPA
jgi:phage terminase large subunit-like protein